MAHQYRENGERNIHSNYSQMTAYAEYSPFPYRHFHRTIDKTLKTLESAGRVFI